MLTIACIAVRIKVQCHDEITSCINNYIHLGRCGGGYIK